MMRCKGGQFTGHAKALPSARSLSSGRPKPDPGDGHTLATVLPETEQQIGVNLERILADASYRRRHNAPTTCA
jgi:IS5 family transposase